MTVPRVSAARGIASLAVCALVVLTARTLAYALAPVPSPVSDHLQGEIGGPSLVAIALVSIAGAMIVAVAVLWIAAIAVRERRTLERQPLVDEPRLRIGRVIAAALVLWIASSLVFALFESYLHARAGLGWHGLSCLLGPVHRDAIPILAALSTIAAAVVCAVELLLAWARRIVALLRQRPVRARAGDAIRAALSRNDPFESTLLFSLGARAPPA